MLNVRSDELASVVLDAEDVEALDEDLSSPFDDAFIVVLDDGDTVRWRGPKRVSLEYES